MTTSVPTDPARPPRPPDPPRTARSRWRRRLKRAALTMLALLLIAGVVLFPYIAATPEPTVDYVAELDRIAREAQPEGENSWPLYEAIQNEMFGRTDKHRTGNELFREFREVRFEYATHGDYNDSRNEERWEFLRAHPELLVAIDRAAEAPGYRVELAPTNSMMDATVSLVQSDLRQVLFANLAAMRVAAHDGDWDAVERRLRTGLLLGRHPTLGPSLIQWLIAVSISALTYQEVGGLAVEYGPPAEVCARLIATLDSIDPYAMPIAHAFEGERLFHLDLLQLNWSRSGLGGGCAILWADPLESGWRAPLHERLWNIRAALHPHRRAAERSVSAYFDQVLAACELDYATLEASRTLFEGLSTEPWDRHWSTLVEGDFSCGGAHWRGIRSARSLATLRAGARFALLVCRWRAEHGRWPSSLDEALSADAAIDPESGLPFECVIDPEAPMPLRVLRPIAHGPRDTRGIVGPRAPIDYEPDPDSEEIMRKVFAPWRPLFERIFR